MGKMRHSCVHPERPMVVLGRYCVENISEETEIKNVIYFKHKDKLHKTKYNKCKTKDNDYFMNDILIQHFII